jgi:hypothetical protein
VFCCDVTLEVERWASSDETALLRDELRPVNLDSPGDGDLYTIRIVRDAPGMEAGAALSLQMDSRGDTLLGLDWGPTLTLGCNSANACERRVEENSAPRQRRRRLPGPKTRIGLRRSLANGTARTGTRLPREMGLSTSASGCSRSTRSGCASYTPTTAWTSRSSLPPPPSGS